MRTLILSFVVSLIGLSADAACTNMKRLPVFKYDRHASGDADFFGLNPTSRNIVVRHSGGISSVSINAKRGAKGQYTETGRGAPLPIGVAVSENLCRKGSTRLFNTKVHARLPVSYQTSYARPFLAPQNRNQAVAFAKSVLQATYCPRGEIKLDPNFRYVDDKGAQPVVKTSPAVQPWDKGSDKTWVVRFTCSQWRAVS